MGEWGWNNNTLLYYALEIPVIIACKIGKI
jgi:hypothetical protein